MFRPTCAVVVVVFGGAALAAPVPAERPPDPLGRGYMGVWFAGSGPNGELLIDRVEPRRPAATAGLRSGDVIVRVNRLHPQTQQQVIDYVCACRPGAVIEVEVRRGDERKAFKVRLTVRPEEGNPVRPGLPDD